MKNLTIVNRSEWPDRFVDVVVPWIVRETGIDWRYRVVLKAYSGSGYAGRGGLYGQRSRCRRRMSPSSIRRQEDRFMTGLVENPETVVERFVWLIAHEARHATAENRAKFELRDSAGRRNVAAGEQDANEWGNEMVRRFRDRWPALRRRILDRWRVDRSRDVLARVGPDRSAKIEAAEKALAAWETKAKRAATYIAKYRRRLSALRAADRRAAAIKPPGGSRGSKA